jgi:hypothetical protein
MMDGMDGGEMVGGYVLYVNEWMITRFSSCRWRDVCASEL